MTQEEKVISYMREFGSITALDAIRDLGIMRLASRVSDLKRHGYAIKSDMVSVTNRWGEKTRIWQLHWLESSLTVQRIGAWGGQFSARLETIQRLRP